MSTYNKKMQMLNFTNKVFMTSFRKTSKENVNNNNYKNEKILAHSHDIYIKLKSRKQLMVSLVIKNKK